MTTSLKRGVYGALLLIVLASPNLVIGCGPFFDEAIFSLTTRPDLPLEDFLSGKLGVIEPIVSSRAYRWTRTNRLPSLRWMRSSILRTRPRASRSPRGR